jgi:hypothetical protein
LYIHRLELMKLLGPSGLFCYHGPFILHVDRVCLILNFLSFYSWKKILLVIFFAH